MERTNIDLSKAAENGWDRWAAYVLQEICHIRESISNLEHKTESLYESIRNDVKENIRCLDNKIEEVDRQSKQDITNLSKHIGVIDGKLYVLLIFWGAVISAINVVVDKFIR